MAINRKQPTFFDSIEGKLKPDVPEKALEKIINEACKKFSAIEQLNVDQATRVINEIRRALSMVSPFKSEPVDFVEWVPADTVTANDYNPNSVAPPEMELLRLSIVSDGYTQPIVSNREEAMNVVVDGFHRHRVGKECEDISRRIHGYLPIVQIKTSQVDRGDRMASTIRHNRARGKHRVEAMSDIVLDLRRRNWSNEKIGKQLGMDPDEVLRLAQITGLAEMFADRDFSEAWEPSISVSQMGDELIDEDAIGDEMDGALR